MALNQATIDKLVSLVRHLYPNWTSFSNPVDPAFQKDEIDYKQVLVAKAQDLLSEASLKQLVQDGDFDGFIDRLTTLGRAKENNLLFLRYRDSSDLSVLEHPKLDRSAFCEVMLDLLYGTDPTRTRLGRYINFLIAQGLPKKWTFPTYFLFLCHPDADIFVKPEAIRRFMEYAGESKELLPSVFSNYQYEAIKTFAHQFKEVLQPYQPRDMVDVQSFIWVCIKALEKQPKYWKIAPGEKAWQWEECRDQGFIAIEWDELSDITSLDRKEFDQRRDQVIAQHPEWQWNKSGADQVYAFAQIKPGDYIVANKGKTKVLGIGTVTGAYYFEPNAPRQKHRLPVHWHDLTPKDVDQKDWQRTLVALKPETFEAIVGGTMPLKTVSSLQVNAQCPFTAKTFELLAELSASPKKTTYLARRDEFKQQLEEPFQKLFRQVATQLPAAITERMETERKLFARIPKNDFNHGGAWDFYWGAFYLKGGKRIEDAQLFLWMNHQRLEFGFYIGTYGGNRRQQFLTNCQTHYDALLTLLEPSLADDDIWYGIRGSQTKLDWKDWLKNPQGLDIHVDMRLSRQDVLSRSTEQLIDQITQTYKRFFPLILLAIAEEPLPLLLDYLEPPDDDDIAEARDLNTRYSLAACAASTYLNESLLGDWVEAIERKGQAVLYGPPGTGKTFLARCLAKHLISEGDGFVELVQFHPAYTYEDFIEGIRPQMGKSGLEYPHVPGRLLEFCEKAEQRHDRCVLIIDEINRANLAQVFGELMYLLEYRDEAMNLASGKKFRIPANVRLISTMNTADRSIALVDHALRRRFAFLYVPPNYEGLRKYHQATGYATANLINLLQHINAQIGDPHYQLGTSFFLRENLDAELKSIWQLEIEPYLEEFFFDQSDKMKNLRWAQVEGQLRP
jgi:5-methylcytosine-specific restriction protein B